MVFHKQGAPRAGERAQQFAHCDVWVDRRGLRHEVNDSAKPGGVEDGEGSRD